MRAALEKAYITAQSDSQSGGLRLAYLEYCEAARMGSAEAHFRAALTALGLSTDESRSAMFHFQAAENLGHEGAHSAMLKHLGKLTSQVVRDAPECLVAPPDLVAMRAAMAGVVVPSFDFEKYAQRLPKDRKVVLDLVHRMASDSSLSVGFVLAIAAVESNFNSVARSPKDAMGVMQLIPATAARFGVKDPYDPQQNIRGGIRYLEWLHRRFKGDLKLVAAAYNAGEGAVDRHKGVPPYSETQLYVQKVLRYMSKGDLPKK